MSAEERFADWCQTILFSLACRFDPISSLRILRRNCSWTNCQSVIVSLLVP